MMQLILLSIENAIDIGQYKNLLPLLSPERQRKIKEYASHSQKIHSLLAELLIRQELAQAHHVSPADIALGYTEYGRPVWTGKTDCCFSVSHSNNRILFVQHTAPIGTDLEMIRPTKLHAARRFFAPAEYDAVLHSSDPNRTFFEIWTKKEAYVKMLGTGLYSPLTSFNVLEDELSQRFTTLSCDGFQLAVCCDQTPSIAITYKTDAQLMSLYESSGCGSEMT